MLLFTRTTQIQNYTNKQSTSKVILVLFMVVDDDPVWRLAFSL